MFETLDNHPIPKALPDHIGIIPDGGRRWASQHHCTLPESYLVTRRLLRDMAEMLFIRGVKELTIYLSSIQNFRREHNEISAYIEAIGKSMHMEIARLVKINNLKIVFAGNREILPAPMKEAIFRMEQRTEKNSGGRLNLLLAYDPYEEVLQAIANSHSYDRFFRYLQVTTPVDLIIRPGGTQLLSNFLPLQSGFARLYFSDKLFNDFTLEDLQGVLNDFAGLNRRFGN
jgi:undecaprenyl pyrophosphate synthase